VLDLAGLEQADDLLDVIDADAGSHATKCGDRRASWQTRPKISGEARSHHRRAKARVALPLPAATSITLEPGLKSIASARSSPTICRVVPILA
jgi:hypothetical protein